MMNNANVMNSNNVNELSRKNGYSLFHTPAVGTISLLSSTCLKPESDYQDRGQIAEQGQFLGWFIPKTWVRLKENDRIRSWIAKILSLHRSRSSSRTLREKSYSTFGIAAV